MSPWVSSGPAASLGSRGGGRGGRVAPPRAHGPGFTLIEVVLAVAISIGLLMVLLFFYQQAANLRTQLLIETERISDVRLVMDRLTADLRCAHADAAGGSSLRGDATSVRFAKAGTPSLAAWTGGQFGRATFPETDVRWVSYSMGTTAEGTNMVATGLIRSEEPGVEARRPRAAAPTALTPLTAMPTQSAAAVERPLAESEPLSVFIRHLRFRYFNGSDWSESWNESGLPAGVEITLAWDPPAEEMGPLQEAGEIFRRVVVLPGGGAAAGEPIDIFEGMEEGAP
jgi:type II secretory pathway pseudopilin PulG